MEGENSNPLPPQIPPEQPPQPAAPVPAPAQQPSSQTPQTPGPARWVKITGGLFALSFLAALFIMVHGVPTPKSKSMDVDMDGVQQILGNKKEGVGWVDIRGVIQESASNSPFDHSGAQQIADRIKELAERKDVKAIVLDINSPGGSVGAVQGIYAEILRARNEQHKPVIAMMRDVAASGGYYLAAGCDRIVAQPGTLTGSIGVIFSMSNVEGLLQKVGVKMDPIKSGKFKDIGSSFRPMTPDERKILQDVIDDAYSQFFDAVKNGRKMKDDDLKALADGRIFTGNQALRVHLVDHLGGEREALEYAKELAHLSKPVVLHDGDAIEKFFSALDSKMSSPLTSLNNKVQEVATPHMSYLWTY
jgi:protease-4